LLITLSVLLPLAAATEISLPGAAEQERFKAFFTQGESLYQQGEYGAAIWNFRQADAIRVTPEVAFDLAKCHEKLGDVAFATFYYRQYLKRAPNATDALDVAERVGTVLAKAEGDGRGLLEVSSPGAVDLSVNRQRFAEGPVAMFLPPGEYEISARFPSGVRTMVAQIRTGKTTPIAFEPVPPPLIDASSAQVMIAQGPKKPLNVLRVSSYAVAGAGLALLVTGIAFGAMSSSEGTRCCSPNGDKTLTPSQQQQLADSANSKAVVANLTLFPGIAATLAGGAMFVVSMVLPEPGQKGASP
jgi:hypothetical protein